MIAPECCALNNLQYAASKTASAAYQVRRRGGSGPRCHCQEAEIGEECGMNIKLVSVTAVIALSLVAGAVAAVDSMLGARRCEKWAIIRSQIRE